MRPLALHLAALALIAALALVLPAYPAGVLTRILLLATFAAGFNLAFGYTGLMSLGHALFFAAGMYGAGLPVVYWGIGGTAALGLGVLSGAAVAALVGLLALRTRGVSFMIVTLMFAQAGYMTILYYTSITRGEEGLVLPAAARQVMGLDLTQDGPRALLAFALFALSLALTAGLRRSGFGRVMVAMRENEERSRMLGFNPYAVKLAAFTLSGLLSGLAGAGWALAYGYIGAGFAGIQYSILPLLYVLLGGAGTTLGPFVGTAAMFVLTDLASELTPAYLFFVGLALVIVVLFAPRGLLGWLRERWLPWLP